MNFVEFGQLCPVRGGLWFEILTPLETAFETFNPEDFIRRQGEEYLMNFIRNIVLKWNDGLQKGQART